MVQPGKLWIPDLKTVQFSEINTDGNDRSTNVHVTNDGTCFQTVRLTISIPKKYDLDN